MNLIDFVLHIDVYLGQIIDSIGIATYIIIFLIIFCETGLVVTPFLPGDSLVIAASALAAIAELDIVTLYICFLISAFLGDTLNYEIGKKIGSRIETKDNPKLIKKEHLEQTHAFFEKNGGKTIVLARFIPVARTLAPFVAGSGKMNYLKFLKYNLRGSIIWVSIFTIAGYFFGNIEFVKNNFSLVILAIAVVTIMPSIIRFLRNRLRIKNTQKEEILK